jgi:predicted RNA-binding Zn-ribbon protein involved in translation (DUF1610 family)
MASFVDAVCPCGFRRDGVVVGMTGMMRPPSHIPMPVRPQRDWVAAACEACRTVVSLDRLAGDPRCPNCGQGVTLYDDPSLFEVPDSHRPSYTPTKSLFRQKVFFVSTFRCPTCRTMRMLMTFSPKGCVD